MGVVSTCRTLLRGICLLCIASSAADRHGVSPSLDPSLGAHLWHKERLLLYRSRSVQAFDEDYIRRQFQNEINSLQELDTKLGVAEGLATQEEEQVLIKLPANIPASPPLDAINSAPAMNAVPVVASAETVSTAPPIKMKQEEYTGLWSYDAADHNAPSDWPTLFSKAKGGSCDGSSQSPIDISTKTASHAAAGKKGWLKVHYPTSKGLGLRNIRNTIQLKGDAFNFNTVEFGGSTWYLHDVTFHRKSETRVNGRQFDLEAQLLHVEPKEGKMLVVSTLFQVSKTPNNLLWAFDWTNLPKTAGQGTGLSPDIDLMQLLPGWLDFWHYEGSLTVPPCSEGVEWIVMKNPLGISQEQLDFFPFSSNFRPPQPLNGRAVTDYHFTSAPVPAPSPAPKR